MVAACWSPAMPAMAMGAPNNSPTLSPNFAEESFTSGSIERGTRRSFNRSSSHCPVWMLNSSVREALVASVACDLAAGQPPQQIAVHRAEQQLAAHCALARAGHMIEDPGDFGAGKIGIDDQAGLGRDRGLVAFALEFGADVGGAAVLPDDGAMHGGTSGAIPHHNGFALVGDADRGDVLGADAGLLNRLAAGRNRRGPDVLRLVLDPAGRREMLREFLLCGCRDGNVGAKHNGARGRGALIDGQHKGHDIVSRK